MAQPMTDLDVAILQALEDERQRQMETLRDGYRAVARFHAKMYRATRHLLDQEWDQVMRAFAGRDEVWKQYAEMLGKTADELSDEDRLRGLIEARPTWPWEQEDGE